MSGRRRRLPGVTLDDYLVPRDTVAARRLLRMFTWGAMVATGGFSLLSLWVPVSATPRWFVVVPLAILPVALLVHRCAPAGRSLVWLGMSLLGVAVITGLNLATSDASAAAQVFFCFPVVYAASYLRPAAAGVVALATVCGSGLVGFTLLPFTSAITDFTYVGLTLMTMTFVLVRAGRRQDELVARLRTLATVDPLTGLSTRRAFAEAAADLLSEAGSDRGSPGTSLLVVDVDRFKDINDTHGHLVGDDALVHVVDVIRSRTRPDAVIGRMGGDEIVVLLPRCDRASALDRAGEFVEAVRWHPLMLEGVGALDVTVSVGVATAPAEGTTFRELFAVADARLYVAKRDGRDRVGDCGTEHLRLPFA